jgi:Fe-S-cluster containining protein
LNIFALALLVVLLILGCIIIHRIEQKKKKATVITFIFGSLVTCAGACLPIATTLKVGRFTFYFSINSENWILPVLYIILFSVNIILYVKIAKLEKGWLKAGFVKMKKITGKENIDGSGHDNISISGNGNSITLQDAAKQPPEEPATHDTAKQPSEEPNIRANKVDEYTHLAEYYTSLYVEDNELRSEKIHVLEQKDGIIKGEMALGGMRYEFDGDFKDMIFKGGYIASQGVKRERGSINMSMYDGFLGGICSISNAIERDRPIRQSPYVWVEGKDVDLLNGTFDFCSNCHDGGMVCCCASEKIDMPVLLPDEAHKLEGLEKEKNRKARKDDFSETNEDIEPLRVMKSKNNNSGTEVASCYFFYLVHSDCLIYANRPIDCRLFPFDIVINPNDGELSVGYYPHLCERQLPTDKAMKRSAHILRPYFFLVYNYPHIIGKREAFPKLFENIKNKNSFRFISTVKDLLF